MKQAFRRSGPGFLLVALAAFFPAVALADSISPATYTVTIPTGTSVTIGKTVTINAGTPTSSLVDVFFLADTTGSMGSVLASVKASAASIVSSTAALGDVQFGVGEYKDVGDVFVYNTNTALTNSQPAAVAGINAWVASGGGDTPEAQLFALQQVATTVAWRPGSARILVWFGDAPGHDPSVGVTLAGAIAALQAQNIEVEALDVLAMNSTGQASAIATATGGLYQASVNPATIVAAINAAITTSFANYSTVCLGTDGTNVGLVDFSSSPTCHSGTFDRSIDRTFDFTVTFTDLVPGTHTFNTYALVDGGIVATEVDSITSAGVPEPSSMILFGMGLSALAARFRRRR